MAMRLSMDGWATSLEHHDNERPLTLRPASAGDRRYRRRYSAPSPAAAVSATGALVEDIYAGGTGDDDVRKRVSFSKFSAPPANIGAIPIRTHFRGCTPPARPRSQQHQRRYTSPTAPTAPPPGSMLRARIARSRPTPEMSPARPNDDCCTCGCTCTSPVTPAAAGSRSMMHMDPEPVYQCGGSAPCSRAGAGGCGGVSVSPQPSPKRHHSPAMRTRVSLPYRDNESLMEENMRLKKALSEQQAQLQRQKVVTSNLENDNRRLEKEIEEMESQGNFKCVNSRLRSKVQGLKVRVAQLEATCEAQQEELGMLRRDMRVTRTRELEAERDVFAEEIERLHNFIRRLKALQNRLFCENKQLWRYKDKSAQLEATTQRLENTSNDLQKSLEKANQEINETTKRGNDSFQKARKAERQYQDLQEQFSSLSNVLEKEKQEKMKLRKTIHVLQDEVQSLEASLSSKTTTVQSSLNVSSTEDYQPNELAKTWGFLHKNPFQPPKRNDEMCVEEFTIDKKLSKDTSKTLDDKKISLQNHDTHQGNKSDNLVDYVKPMASLAKPIRNSDSNRSTSLKLSKDSTHSSRKQKDDNDAKKLSDVVETEKEAPNTSNVQGQNQNDTFRSNPSSHGKYSFEELNLCGVNDDDINIMTNTPGRKQKSFDFVPRLNLNQVMGHNDTHEKSKLIQKEITEKMQPKIELHNKDTTSASYSVATFLNHDIDIYKKLENHKKNTTTSNDQDVKGMFGRKSNSNDID